MTRIYLINFYLPDGTFQTLKIFAENENQAIEIHARDFLVKYRLAYLTAEIQEIAIVGTPSKITIRPELSIEINRSETRP